MICEVCQIEENYDDSKGDIVVVGVCGGCHMVSICITHLDAHQDNCIGWQMMLKESAILQ